MASCNEITSCRDSVECVDDPTPRSVVVVYGDSTFHISVPQEVIERTASGEGQGPHSSVRPFQFAHYDQTSQDSPETNRNSLSSPQEEEEEGGLIGHQPST